MRNISNLFTFSKEFEAFNISNALKSYTDKVSCFLHSFSRSHCPFVFAVLLEDNLGYQRLISLKITVTEKMKGKVFRLIGELKKSQLLNRVQLNVCHELIEVLRHFG
jgi:hypothetical protein